MAGPQTIRNSLGKPSKERKPAEKPLKVYHHRKRKYVRLEVNSPLKFRVIEPVGADLELTDQNSCSGTVLNISGGGVLMETSFRVQEGDFLVMQISLLDVEIISNIIGKVKRVDTDEKGPFIIGVEFLTAEQIQRELPADLVEQLGDQLQSFDEQLRKMLLKYVFSHRTEDVKE